MDRPVAGLGLRITQSPQDARGQGFAGDSEDLSEKGMSLVAPHLASRLGYESVPARSTAYIVDHSVLDVQSHQLPDLENRLYRFLLV